MRRWQLCIIPGFALIYDIYIDMLQCKTDLVKENSVVTVTVSPKFQVGIPTTGFKTCFVARLSERLVVKARGEKGSEAC